MIVKIWEVKLIEPVKNFIILVKIDFRVKTLILLKYFLKY